SPDETSWSVSAASRALPFAASSAPPAPAEELSHPRPGSPALPHGQATDEPSPKQKATALHSHSSGIPLPFASRLAPLAMSHASSVSFALQSDSGAKRILRMFAPISAGA